MAKITPSALRGLVKPGTYADGAGLYLRVRQPDPKPDALPGDKPPPVNRSWFFRWKRTGKTRWLGLGAFDDVGLADAREAARQARKVVLGGGDPIAAKRTKKADAEEARRRTFREVAEGYIKAHEAGWKNDKHRQQWRNTLAQHVYPVIGDKPVAAIQVGDVMDVLEELWRATPETASRVRGRIEAVLDHASARGWRTGDNPARWRGHLAALLPARAKVARVEHYSALPWRRVGAFMAALRDQPGVAARALELAILTAARSGEVRGMTWAEVDLDEALWIVPAARMKAKREHRVPLSEPAMAALRTMAEVRTGDLIFPGAKRGRPLSDMSLSAVVRRMNAVGEGEAVPWVDRAGEPVVPHGFRSTFKDWTTEATAFPRELAEMALAHTLGDRVEAAYQRGDALEKRKAMMTAWATFCDRPAAPAGEVVPIRARE